MIFMFFFIRLSIVKYNDNSIFINPDNYVMNKKTIIRIIIFRKNIEESL
jgi:hypothetical protein